MKKVTALLMAVLFSFSFAAFAEEKPTTDAGAAKIEGGNPDNSTQVKKQKTTKKSKKTKKTKKTKKSKKTKKTEKKQQESQER